MISVERQAVPILHVLTGSKGESLGSRMEEVGEGGAVAVTGISVHSLAVATCGGMADEKQTQINEIV